MFSKTVAEQLHLLTAYPKLNLLCALKKCTKESPHGAENRCHQTQDFAKIFPSAIALALHIHFYLHFCESS